MEEKSLKDVALDVAQNINKEFIDKFTLPKWNNYSATSRYKSVRRAIRRGHVDLISGVIYPNRPFNNRKPTIGRSHNQLKKRVYGQIRELQ